MRHDTTRDRVPGLLFWQVCVLAGIMGIIASRHFFPGLAAAAILAAVPGRQPATRYATLFLCLLAGLGAGHLSTPADLKISSGAPDPNQKVMVTGLVAEVSGLSDRRLRILLVDAKTEDGTAIPGHVSWVWDQAGQPDLPRPLPGQTVTLTSKIRPVSGFANAGVSSFRDYWAVRDVAYTAWTLGNESQVKVRGQAGFFAKLREQWRVRMLECLGGSSQARSPYRQAEVTARTTGMSQERAMLPALLFGDRYAMDTSTFALFTRAGLVHSLALSGQHLALAATAAALLIWLFSRGRSNLFLFLPRRTLILTLGIPFAVAYLWLGNSPPSLVRASLMMLFGAFLWLGKKPATLLDILFFTALCFIAAWPQAVFDLSVQLSMLSVAGIALALPWIRKLDSQLKKRINPPLPGKSLRGLALLMATSLAVQIATLPVLITIFGRISPFFALNVVWLPLLGMIVLPVSALGLLFLAVLGPQPLSDFLFWLAALPGDFMLQLLTWLDGFGLLPELQALKPTGFAILGYAAAVTALAILRGRSFAAPIVRRLTLAALLLLPFGAVQREAEAGLARLEDKVALRMLDVGQGQALLIEWPAGRLLLDAGGLLSYRLDPGRDVVAQALTVNRPPRLSLAMLSHGDLDHARGMLAILRLFSVPALYHSVFPFKGGAGDPEKIEAVRRQRNIALHTLQAGDIIQLDKSLTLEILHPPAAGNFSSNNASLVARLVRDGKGLALMAGDTENPALRHLLRTRQNLQAEVLIIPHHGSAKSMWPEFYDAVNPGAAFISCGAYNSFGFPRPEVLQALQERHIKIHTTAQEGELRMTWARHASPVFQSFRRDMTSK